MEAETEAAVLRALEEKRLFPISVAGQGAPAPGETAKRRRRRVKSRDVGVMYGQMADLLGSGVPLLRTIDSLVRSTAAPALRELLREIRGSVAEGKSLTDSMRQYPETFPPLHTAMVQA